MLCFYTEYKLRRRRKVGKGKRRGGGRWEWSEMFYIYVITGMGDRKCILL
jgi:hypothetical protein